MVTLRGKLVRLEPLEEAHAPGLAAAAEEGRDSYGFTWVPRAEEAGDYVAQQLKRMEAGLTPFAQVRVADDRVVGATAYWNPRPWPDGRPGLRAVEIGFTWLSASAQGGGINTEAKLLLIRHAFEELGVARVDFCTDERNARSRAALEAIGATFEGVLRNWGPSWVPGEQGRLRNSAIFSIVVEEWPACEQHLLDRLERTARV